MGSAFKALFGRGIRGFSGSGSALGSSATDGFVLVVQFLTSVLTARALLPEGRGELTTILLWPTFFFGLIGNGFKFSMLYHVASYPQKRVQVIYTGFWFLLLVSPLVAAANFLFAEYALTKVSAQAVALTQFLGSFVPVLLFASFAQMILQGDRRFRLWNGIRMADAFLFLLAVSVLFGVGRAGLVEITLAFLIMKGTVLLFTFRYLYFRKPERVDRQLCRSQFIYMAKCLPTGWMGQANTQLDQMLLSVFFRPELLGLYRVAVSAANFIRFVPIGFQRTILSQTAAITDSSSRLRHIFRGLKQGGLLTLLAVVPFFLLIGIFIHFAYGGAYAESIPAARVLVLAAAVAGLSGIMGNGLKGLGRPLVQMVAELGGVVVTAVGLPLLLPRLGILGAGLTSLASYLVVCLYLLFYLLRLRKKR